MAITLFFAVILWCPLNGGGQLLKDTLTAHEWFQRTLLNMPGMELSVEEPRVVLISLSRWDASSETVSISMGSTAITLYRNRGLLHPHFVMLHRHENGTSIATTPSLCTFRTLPEDEPKIAADICDGLHGIMWNNNKLYRIQPLPKQYWTNSFENIPHLITQLNWNSLSNKTGGELIQKPEFYEELIEEMRSTKDEELFELSPTMQKKHRRKIRRIKRFVSPAKVETAVFVDRDLLRYMQNVFPRDTERHLLRFVLAMFNAVQLLYHEPSLAMRLDFVLKRLEILHSEPNGLQRPSDIDRYLSSFCKWQENQQPSGHGQLGWDHALMLTGLDLYVISKSGRISSQVVGLAPVAGMCLPRSSCTVNEGRHFESVFVVAHEIGHNLGMRHDGPSADNECDPSEHIMAPTLGSGRFTWSECSRRYLQTFLQSPQAECLFKSSGAELDHGEGGVLPGERFDSNMQCTLKHGPGSVHDASSYEADMCKDLRCTKERFTWTAHPALEGTVCSPGKWCRGGQCIPKHSIHHPSGPVDGGWSEWGPLSECASACLRDPVTNSGGSAGISVASRRCNNPRPENGGRSCIGSDKRYQTCNAEQCANIAPSTITDFAEAICRRAREVETDLTGFGRQRTFNREEACTVWCDSRSGGAKSKGWIFPDGTTCDNGEHPRIKMYCIAGKCEEFSCGRNGTFIDASDRCPTSIARVETKWTPVGPCHSNCIVPGRGLRVLKRGSELNIQLCHLEKACGRRRTVYDYANKVCGKFKERVKKLSGLGIQLSQVAEEPDRPCQVACQDMDVQSRFYLVTGEDGWFPYGTDCSKGMLNGKAYCVSGKCLEFGASDTPLLESQFVFPHIKRRRRSLEIGNRTVLARLDGEAVAKVIRTLHTGSPENWEPSPSSFILDWDNPIHVSETLPSSAGL